MTQVHTTILDEVDDAPRRLGRHVEHDERSVAFAVPALPTSVLRSVRWTRRSPVFDQGDLGSCTGNAAAGWVGTDNAHRQGDTSMTEEIAVEIYEAATMIDGVPGEYPPDDTGSSGLAVAKVLRTDGYTDSYRHAFSLKAAVSALQTGPVMFGTVWLAGMFAPGPDGRLTVSGDVAGGHEYLVDEVDVGRRRLWLTNSWGGSWGVDGRAWLSYTDAQTLLSQQGDVTVPH